MGPEVRLAAIDDELLARLTRLATTDAGADEVTPPLAPGGEWTPERVAWFEDYHRACRAGLDGPRGEATWAVLVHDEPVGCVRLARVPSTATVETGIWLARGARGRGISHRALAAVVDEARRAGADEVRADTAATNLAAQAALRRTGLALSEPAAGRVAARMPLRKAPHRPRPT